MRALVNRGYLTRSPDPGDRRRNSLELTGRGQEVVQAVRHGVEDVDQRLLARVSADQVEAMRVVLAHYTALGFTTLAYPGGAD
jgi:DNA-binding MarR family transcriptional regulator